jgi:hypothetical protein
MFGSGPNADTKCKHVHSLLGLLLTVGSSLPSLTPCSPCLTGGPIIQPECPPPRVSHPPAIKVFVNLTNKCVQAHKGLKGI